MKPIMMLVCGLGLIFAAKGLAGDGKEKVYSLGKEGLKIEGRISKDDPQFKFKLQFQGQEFEVPMAAKLYRVKFQAGNLYTIALDKAAAGLDPFLILQDADGKMLAFDDDSGGNLNSRLTHTIAKDGIYKVFAAALDGSGDFTLKITEAEKFDPKKVYSVDKEGLKINGILTKEVRKMNYQIKMEKGKTYTITLRSSAFDAYLFLHGTDGKLLTEDDDNGGGLDSRIIHKAETSGNFLIVASSLGMGGTGDFVLEISARDLKSRLPKKFQHGFIETRKSSTLFRLFFPVCLLVQ